MFESAEDMAADLLSVDVAAGIDLVVSVVDGGANHEGGAAVLAVEATDSEPESAGE